jgi:hypothetical protein
MYPLAAKLKVQGGSYTYVNMSTVHNKVLHIYRIDFYS